MKFAESLQLLLRRDGGVPGRDRGRAGRPARLHRDEPADPGRAHRHRGDHRRRPGPGPDADRVRGERWPTSGCARTSSGSTAAALQCRITTEDPANGFRPDTGTITAYRSAGGAGVRLDGGTADTGVEISAHFDSMLVKLTCRGRTFEAAVARARRALAEFRIRGVSTNIPFLQAVLEDPDFIAGDVSTAFIEQRPELLTTHAPADRGTKLLRWLAEVTVNQPHGAAPTLLDPGVKRPAGVDLTVPSPKGSRQRLLELGPEAFAADLRARTGVEVTDTTFRDAHQSLLATRVRTKDLLRIAPYVGRMTSELLSVECWGGATYDVALRFIAEDPWERLAALRYNMPGLCLQMLLRGRNTVGYTPYPTKVTTSFVAEAAEVGIDIFRIFDALNDVEQMRPAIEAVRETGSTVAEVALCYTGDLTSPKEDIYTLDYYLKLAEKIVDAGAHILAIKDMAGLLRPPAAKTLVTALRAELRPARAPAHPRHGRRPAGHPAGRGRRRGGRGRRGLGTDGRDHLPGAGVGAGRRAGEHRAGDPPGPAGGDGPGAVLGGGAQGLRAVRVGAAGTDRPGLRPRDPRRPAVQPAAAGDRPRAGGEVRADRGDVRRGQPDPRPADQGDPVVEGGRRPGAAPGRRGGRPGRVRGQPAELRHPGLGDRLPRRRAGRPARRLAGAVPDQGAAGSYGASSATRSCPRRTRPPWTRTGRSARPR